MKEIGINMTPEFGFVRARRGAKFNSVQLWQQPALTQHEQMPGSSR